MLHIGLQASLDAPCGVAGLIMKVAGSLKDWFKRQMTAESPRRILLTVVLVVGSFWLTKTVYTEWKLMRVVSVITEHFREMRHSKQFTNERQEPGINSNRA